MTTKQFFEKFKSRFLWGNIIAMIAVVAVLLTGVKIGLALYTHHGEAIEVPDVNHMSMDNARRILTDAGLTIAVSDTGYIKELPADCVLEQKPAAGTKVKEGHVITVVVNASNTPVLTMPDIIDNCSLREATARLKAMGFRLTEPQEVDGERDWVLGVTVDGMPVRNGDRIPVNKMVTIQTGNGRTPDSDSIQHVDFHMTDIDNSDIITEGGDIDDFEEIP